MANYPNQSLNQQIQQQNGCIHELMSKCNVNISEDQPHVQSTSVVNIQPLNSPSTSIRRTLSYDTEDDFTLVRSEK
ncbi:unnamed protein product [Rotaria sp. Silwood1]|nr:unnamed protein product [Rotaria sp. Silwood1]CAF1482335.1 unnamed protein product [Rotaria sp. Silwood1]CAF1529281.1 unnamed protein product [Rotaria sp. Silwood1]CAF3595572.1 unnamed protein product [Rotaria sp. Silwood1]CAF3628771.1 unnamed protein product [Rotaria sp. Silwood1]